MSAKTSHEMLRVRSLAAISIVGGVLFALMVVALHFLPTGYDSVNDVVSDYAIGPHGWMMDLAFAAAGIAGISLAIALSRLKDSRLYRFGTVLLLIAGAATLLLAIFPIDLKGAAMTSDGAVHSLASLIVFVFQPIGIILVSRSFGHRAFALSLLALAAAGAVFVMVAVFSSGAAGMSERVLVAAISGWSLLVSVSLFRGRVGATKTLRM